MRSFITAPQALVALTMCMAFAPGVTQADDQPKVDPARLAASVKDILRTRCYECHGQSSRQLDIDVLDWNSLIKNKTVIPQQPDASPLYQAITNADEDVRMPQDLPALSAAEIELVRQWIVGKAPEFPIDVVQPKETAKEQEFRSVAGVDYVLKQIHQHQRTLTADTVQPSLGKELVTLFASETAFPAGQIYRGQNIDDRIVHRFYHLDTQRGEVKTQQDPSKVFKRTIEIETR